MLRMPVLATLLTAAVAAAAEPEAAIRLRLVNAAPGRIKAVHVSPSTQSGWGENLLGRGAMTPAAGRLASEGLAGAASSDLFVPGSCGVYDVRIVVADEGKEFLLDEVELCEDGDVLTVTDGELTHVKARDFAPGR